MKHFLNKIKFTAAVLAISFAIPANSQWAVIDPANLVQNTITALQMVEDYALQIKKYQEMIKTNQAKLKNLDKMQSTVIASSIAKSLLENTGKLEKTLKDGREIADTMKYWYGASKKSPEEFLNTLAKQQKAGDKKIETWMLHYKDNGTAIQEAHKSFLLVAEQMEKIAGPTEGLQALNASIGIMIKQNASMMSWQQLNALDKAEEQAKKNQSLKGIEIYNQTQLERLKAAASPD